jgi:hypothetical protein
MEGLIQTVIVSDRWYDSSEILALRGCRVILPSGYQGLRPPRLGDRILQMGAAKLVFHRDLLVLAWISPGCRCGMSLLLTLPAVAARDRNF